MAGLQVKRGDTVYTFAPDMQVYVNSAPVGNWRATAQGAEEKHNGIHFDVSGNTQPFVPVKYAFNKDNQLTVTIAAAAGGVSLSHPQRSTAQLILTTTTMSSTACLM